MCRYVECKRMHACAYAYLLLCIVSSFALIYEMKCARKGERGRETARKRPEGHFPLCPFPFLRLRLVPCHFSFRHHIVWCCCFRCHLIRMQKNKLSIVCFVSIRMFFFVFECIGRLQNRKYVAKIPRCALVTFVVIIITTTIIVFCLISDSFIRFLFFFFCFAVQRPVNVKSRPRLPIPDDEDPYSIAGNNCNISNENSDSSGYSGSSNSNGKIKQIKINVLRLHFRFIVVVVVVGFHLKKINFDSLFFFAIGLF